MPQNLKYQEPSANPMMHYLNALSPGSHKSTRYKLDKVAKYLSRNRDDAYTYPWATLDKNSTVTIQSWLLRMYQPITINHFLVAVRGVLKQSWRLGLINEEQYHIVRQGLDNTLKGKPVRRRRTILAYNDITRLFDFCASYHIRSARRNTVVLALLYGANISPTEVVALQIEHYDPRRSRINIVESDTPRTIRLNPDAQAILQAWLLHRGPGAGPLLCPVLKNDEVQIHRPLSYQSLTNICARLAKDARITIFKPKDLNATHRQHVQDRHETTLEIPRPPTNK